MEKEQKFIVDYEKQLSEIEEITINLENGLSNSLQFADLILE